MDKVLLQLRKKDLDAPDASKKMQWLRQVFPKDTPEDIYARSKELYAAAAHEHRDVSPNSKGAIKLKTAERDISFSDRNLGTKNKSAEVVARMSDAVNDALARAGYKGRPVRVGNRSDFGGSVQKASPTAEGWTMPYGTMYVDAAKHSSIRDAVYTAFHEAFHRGELGTQAEPYRAALERARGNKTVDAVARKIEAERTSRGIPFSRTQATREALAEINGLRRTGDAAAFKERTGVDANDLQRASAFSTVRKFIESAKAFFSRLFGHAMSDHEVLNMVDNIFKNANEEPVTRFRDIAHSDRSSSDLRRELAQGNITRAEYDKQISAQNLPPKLHPDTVEELQSIKKVGDEADRELESYRKKFEDLKEKVQSTIDKKAAPGGKKGAPPLGPVRKAVNLVTDVRRMGALSGLSTFAKLAVAVTSRLVQSPLERAIAGGLAKLPVIKDIAAGARRYGGGLHGEGAVLAKTFSKDTWEQMKRAFSTGHLDIDKYRNVIRALSEDSDEEIAPTRPILDSFVRAHKAVKTVAQLNEYHRSYMLRYQYEFARLLAKGLSPGKAKSIVDSEVMQLRFNMEAYADSQRAILMQSNKLHEVIERAILAGEKSDNLIHNAASFAAKMLMPVRKIPLNYANEALETFAGGLMVAPKLYRAIKYGADKLTPVEKDYIMRNLSRQTIGATLVALGIAGANAIGGYYQGPQDYKQKVHPHPGDIKVGGTTVSHKLTHSPALELLQMAATYKHVADKRGAGAGALASGAGLVKTLPFVDQFARLQDAAKSQYNQNKYVDNLIKGLIIPTGVSDVARMKDSFSNPTVTGRKTKDLKTTLQSGIPIAREHLPAYKD